MHDFQLINARLKVIIARFSTYLCIFIMYYCTFKIYYCTLKTYHCTFKIYFCTFESYHCTFKIHYCRIFYSLMDIFNLLGLHYPYMIQLLIFYPMSSPVLPKYLPNDLRNNLTILMYSFRIFRNPCRPLPILSWSLRIVDNWCTIVVNRSK